MNISPVIDAILNSRLVLDDGINAATYIVNPFGIKTYTSVAWVAISALNTNGLTGLFLTNLASLTTLEIYSCGVLSDLTVDNTALLNLNLDDPTEFNNLILTGNTGLKYLNLESLHHTDSGLTITNNTAMTTLVVTVLDYVNGTLDLSGNSALPGLSFPALTTWSGDADFTGCTLLASVSMPVLIGNSAGGPGNTLDMSGLSALTAFTIPAVWPFVDSFTVDLSGCALTQAAVDAILASALASSPAIATSTIILTGGTNSAPSGAGIANAVLLNAAGNTVTHN